jgi:hypothetical protein
MSTTIMAILVRGRAVPWLPEDAEDVPKTRVRQQGYLTSSMAALSFPLRGLLAFTLSQSILVPEPQQVCVDMAQRQP